MASLFKLWYSNLKREFQREMEGADEMVDALPKECNVGCKRNARGRRQSWVGWKIPMDVADGGVPISCIGTSASVHDS